MPNKRPSLSLVLLLPALAGAAVAAPSSAPMAQTAQDLTTIQQQIQAGQQQQEQLKAQAAALDLEIADLQAAAVKAAGKVQDTEAKVTELEDTLAALSQEEKTKTKALAAERNRLTQAVVALQRLSSEPPEAMLFSTQSPIDAARSARLLGVITPALDARARALQSDLNELQEMRQQMAEQRDQLASAVDQLAGENARLSDLIGKKAEAQRSTLAESASTQSKLEKLAGQAKNLQDLVDRLNKAKAETGPAAPQAPDISGNTQLASAQPGPKSAERMQQPADFRNFPDADHIDGQNAVFAPARGRILTHFGDPTDSGGISKGLVIETRPGAQVVAPFDGRIAFEGPFRSYGQILIIEHGGGYHTVLAGLDRLDAVVGQWLLAGEPVGAMAQSGDSPAGAQPGAAPPTERPKLYLELRRNGQPIDPVPWFGTAEAKAVNSKGQ
ncbi:MAG TPA: peptidoglycan DD-metalloendopeptidase family protein [Candidatus Cybelea sp.]|nr:peptidoglycan DD-metalloendopeptidase family protein [Candidatus Cybelea sp.]